MTAKPSGNALKQGKMSRRIAIDQNVFGWDGGHPWLTV